MSRLLGFLVTVVSLGLVSIVAVAQVGPGRIPPRLLEIGQAATAPIDPRKPALSLAPYIERDLGLGLPQYEAHLVRCTELAHGVAMNGRAVQHDDNGSTLKATTAIAMLS
ncbi:MAG: hypothetical protein AB7G13_09965 [Lautropia sp.]